MPTTPNPNGFPNSYFIARVRRELRDPPKTFTDTFTGDALRGGLVAGSQPFTLQRSPIINPNQEAVNGVQCKVSGGTVTVVYDTTPAAGQVNVVTETGELVFGTTPPASAPILVTYQAASNGTQQILDALLEGLAALFPELYQFQTDQTSVVLTPTTTEYTLPAVFGDPRIQLLSLEIAPPAGIITYFDSGLWELVGPNDSILKMERSWPPGSICRLTYNAPYQSLSDTEVQVMWLPAYYALARLLYDQETRRTRQGDLIALAGEGGSKPGDATNAGDRWMQMFVQGKSQFAVNENKANTVKDRSVERLSFQKAVGFSWDPF